MDGDGNPRQFWYYNMVGTRPNQGGTTTYNAPIVPVAVDLRNADGSPRFVTNQFGQSVRLLSTVPQAYVDNVLLKRAPLRIVDESSFLQPGVLTLLTKSGSGVQSVRQLRDRTVSSISMRTRSLSPGRTGRTQRSSSMPGEPMLLSRGM